MSIQSEIDRLNAAKASIAASLQAMGVAPPEGTTLEQYAAQLAAIAAAAPWLPLAGGIMTGDIQMGGGRITGVGEPQEDTDAARKGDLAGKLDAPEGGTTGQILEKTEGGTKWTDKISSDGIIVADYKGETSIDGITVPVAIMLGQNIDVSWPNAGDGCTYILKQHINGRVNVVYEGEDTRYTDTIVGVTKLSEISPSENEILKASISITKVNESAVKATLVVEQSGFDSWEVYDPKITYRVTKDGDLKSALEETLTIAEGKASGADLLSGIPQWAPIGFPDNSGIRVVQATIEFSGKKDEVYTIRDGEVIDTLESIEYSVTVKRGEEEEQTMLSGEIPIVPASELYFSVEDTDLGELKTPIKYYVLSDRNNPITVEIRAGGSRAEFVPKTGWESDIPIAMIPPQNDGTLELVASIRTNTGESSVSRTFTYSKPDLVTPVDPYVIKCFKEKERNVYHMTLAEAVMMPDGSSVAEKLGGATLAGAAVGAFTSSVTLPFTPDAVWVASNYASSGSDKADTSQMLYPNVQARMYGNKSAPAGITWNGTSITVSNNYASGDIFRYVALKFGGAS